MSARVGVIVLLRALPDLPLRADDSFRLGLLSHGCKATLTAGGPSHSSLGLWSFHRCYRTHATSYFAQHTSLCRHQTLYTTCSKYISRHKKPPRSHADSVIPRGKPA